MADLPNLMKTLPFLALLIATAHGGTLTIDKAKSRIQVDAKATGHEFTGTLADYKATVTGNDHTLAPASFYLSWKFSDLKTANEKRDAEMLKWLGGPSAEGGFRFTKTWAKDGQNYAQGDLSLHGVSKTIAFPYSVKKDGDWVTIDGTATLDYTAFGLPVIQSFAVMKVSPALSVRFHLVGESK